ncbi:MAG: hypothetical protein AB7K71_19660 [Polyangiaceae bacterium]
MRPSRLSLVNHVAFVSLIALSSCSSKDEGGIATSGEDFSMTTGEFSLDPGEERYLCYTQPVSDTLYFKSFSIDDNPSIHHMFFARTLAEEQSGEFECDVLFKPTWLPLFTTGNGAASLSLPDGSGFKVEAGGQLLIQLHLLNTTAKAVKSKATVRAKTFNASLPEKEAALFPFGTTVFELPPMQQSKVEHECVMHKDMDAFVLFPHMHTRGARMTFEVGSDAASAKTVFDGAWDFDNQALIPQKVALHQGDYTKTTCYFDNDTDQTLKYGESTYDEMCFLSLFIESGESLDGHCVDMSALDPGDAGVPPDPDAGVCGETPENSLGIGKVCAKGAGECASGLTCSADQSGDASGVCIKIGGCTTNDDCGGGGATCCAPAQAGGAIKICIPEACRPSDCTPQ